MWIGEEGAWVATVETDEWRGAGSSEVEGVEACGGTGVGAMTLWGMGTL